MYLPSFELLVIFSLAADPITASLYECEVVFAPKCANGFGDLFLSYFADFALDAWLSFTILSLCLMELAFKILAAAPAVVGQFLPYCCMKYIITIQILCNLKNFLPRISAKSNSCFSTTITSDSFLVDSFMCS